ncbi:MAG TPA: hypothetical protein RMH99_02635 [Sandaracinaceae bacterium LLY-WYZ-13_1]|nr:hypothetical protein [Sandaracinaceae bacterium LLY-WYZ-13_1]
MSARGRSAPKGRALGGALALVWVVGCQALLDPEGHEHPGPVELPADPCETNADCAAGGVCEREGGATGRCAPCWRAVGSFDVHPGGALESFDVLVTEGDDGPVALVGVVTDRAGGSAELHAVPLGPRLHPDPGMGRVESLTARAGLPAARALRLRHVDWADGREAVATAAVLAEAGGTLRAWAGPALDPDDAGVARDVAGTASPHAALVGSAFGDGDGPRAWLSWLEDGRVRAIHLAEDRTEEARFAPVDAPFLAGIDGGVVFGASASETASAWVVEGDAAPVTLATPERAGPVGAAARAGRLHVLGWRRAGARASLLELDCLERCGPPTAGPTSLWGRGPLTATSLAQSRVGPLVGLLHDDERDGPRVWLSVLAPDLAPRTLPGTGTYVEVDAPASLASVAALRIAAAPRPAAPWPVAVAERRREPAGPDWIRVFVVRACGTGPDDLRPPP